MAWYLVKHHLYRR